MKIEMEYDVGDTVEYNYSNGDGIRSGIIEYIQVTTRQTADTEINYCINGNSVDESDILGKVE